MTLIWLVGWASGQRQAMIVVMGRQRKETRVDDDDGSWYLLFSIRVQMSDLIPLTGGKDHLLLRENTHQTFLKPPDCKLSSTCPAEMIFPWAPCSGETSLMFSAPFQMWALFTLGFNYTTSGQYERHTMTTNHTHTHTHTHTHRSPARLYVTHSEERRQHLCNRLHWYSKSRGWKACSRNILWVQEVV